MAALPRPLADAAAVGFSSIVAGILASTLFGIYLWRQLNVYGRHWNEAFSALAIADYKCFLRIKIDRHGSLAVYPIGLERIRDERDNPPAQRTHLIEGPVEIS